MTLILALGNPDYTIQLSDRKLSVGGAPITKTENKAALLTCLDANLLVGFTGVATAGSGFRTARWLLESFLAAAPPDYRAQRILDRFVRIATDQFRKPLLRNRALSVMFTGYAYWFDPPRWIGALVSNFQDFISGRDEREPWTEFRTVFYTQKSAPVDEPVATYVQRVGAYRVLPEEALAPLREMVRERRPATAVIGKAVEVMRAAADDPDARRTVSRELTSAILSPDRRVAPTVDYHTVDAVHAIPLINQARLMGPQDSLLMIDPVFAAQNPGATSPIRVEKVGRNAPCPCGSGKKYKHCHGA